MTSQHAIPKMPQEKASPASPKVTEDDGVELEDVDNEEKLPLHEDVMQLARLGELGPIRTLLDQGKYDAKYKDEEGITPLHWAAINNHYAVCKYLIESGADVNAIGGESQATPAMWAAQKCHFYIVHLLLENGTDTSLTDGQGYNILHLATFDGNVFLILILLHQNIPIDGTDPVGHTPLMWAAYKGYPAVVELLLQWGATVNLKDDSGFTALHWSLVKGNALCILKLIEAGADRFTETNEGKAPASVAHEMNTKPQWHRALRESGFNSNATVRQVPSLRLSFIKNRTFLDRFFFLCPFPLLFVVFYIVAKMPVFVGIPLSMFIAYTLQFAAQQLLTWAPSNMKHLHRTPYLAGVFGASLFWVGFRWITKVLLTTSYPHPVLNFLFAVSLSFCAYFYIFSMAEDPGYIPKLGSRVQQKAVIDELISMWKFDDDSFCVYCMARVPVRSKHCKQCTRCVAKQDHHCPWINNCVGANNLRHFFLYVLSMEVGILVFVRLAVYHLDTLPTPPDPMCNILTGVLCEYALRDPLTVVVAIWACLQLVWVTMLLVVQSVQIARAQTTYESMRGNPYHASQASEAITSALTAGTTTLEGAQLPGGTGGAGGGMGANPAVANVSSTPPPRKGGCFEQWKKLLGLDTFIATAAGGNNNRRRRNPFSRGVLTNCRDFWCDPAPYFYKRETGAAMLDGAVVNYTRMYETPPRMRMRRARDGDGAYQSVGDDDTV